jgi:hypothetical protein
MFTGKSESSVSKMGIGLAVGLTFGSVIGLLAGDLIMFAGGGMVLGGAIGRALELRNKNTRE